jgi:hypothetical protein
MSQFQKSYKETIRNLKLEHIPQNKQNKQIALFQNYKLDLFTDIEIVTQDAFIKLSNKKNLNNKEYIEKTTEPDAETDPVAKTDASHTETAEPDAKTANITYCSLVSKNREKNYYDDIIKLLPSLIDNYIVDDDFLSGLYFNKQIIQLKNISCFIGGFVKNSVLHGLSYNTKLKYYGCDKTFNYNNKKLYINGISKKCDMHDINSVRSINLQMGEIIPIKSLDLYICDIKCNTYQDLLNCYLIQQSFMKLKGIIILRLPMDLNPLIHLLLFFIMHYKYVSIFKTPWGLVPKYYIILKEQKKEIESAKYSKLITYAKNKFDVIFNDDIINKELETINKLAKDINSLVQYDHVNLEEINNACLELI